MTNSFANRSGTIHLETPATVVVIGGGPAGCFFSIEALRQARHQGRELNVIIIEQKGPSVLKAAAGSITCREGCNYCAGGISPRLVDILDEIDITLPPEVIQSRIQSVTIQGSWKHIEMRVPSGRQMLSVYRGSRPCVRSRRNENFDSYLLSCASAAGARVITGQACGVKYSSEDRPVVRYLERVRGKSKELEIEADFVVVAGGVNQTAGMSLEKNQLIKSLRELIPKFKPPEVRKTLICEFRVAKDHAKGELYFVEYGSRELNVEMSSLIPKEEGLTTLVLLGRSVDHIGDDDKIGLIKRFLGLPQVRRLLPNKLTLEVVCACFPNMTVGTARSPFGHRVGLIGDMAVARLYKDGIQSAYATAKALATCIIERGVDANSLKNAFWPAVHSIKKDNRFGKVVFLLNRIAFSHQILSRVLYQAVLTERKSRREADRYLEKLLWKIASGDDTYRNVLLSMITPKAVKAILVGGFLVTVRNYVTECFFGLCWGEIGRYPTGVYHEVLEAKREEYSSKVSMPDSGKAFDFERMYSIRVRTNRDTIFEQLGRFGEQNMEYFRPRIVKIGKISGSGNEVGKAIRYNTPFSFLTFTLYLEQLIDDRYIVYRICSGFGKGGVLIFDVEETAQDTFLLSIYVAFNFPRGCGRLRKIYWKLFRLVFPQFVHDVLWNYALCQLKEAAESA